MPRIAASLALLVFAVSGCNCEGDALQQLVAALSVDATRVDFGNVVVGTTQQHALRLTSVGSADVHPTRISVAGQPFAVIVDVPQAMAPGAVLELVVTAAPDAAAVAGPVEGLLQIESDAATGTLDVIVTANLVDAPDCDDDNDCTTDTFDNDGRCQHVPRAGACDDDNACTNDERCVDGVCLGEGVVCTDNIACTVDRCDQQAGCVFEPSNDVCVDDDACSLNVCAPDDAGRDELGCTFPPAPDGTPCGAFAACSSIDLCIAHVCVPVSIPDNTPCNDGDVCTSSDACAEGVCLGVLDTRPPEVLFSTTLATDTAVFPSWEPEAVVVGVGASASLVLADRLLMHMPLNASEPTWSTGPGRAVSLPHKIVDAGDGSLVVVGNSDRAAGTVLPATVNVVDATTLEVRRQFVLADRGLRLLGVNDGVAYGCVGVDLFSGHDLLVLPLDGRAQQRFVDDAVCQRFVVGGHGVAIAHGSSAEPAHIFTLSEAGSTEVASFSTNSTYLEFGIVGAQRAVVASPSAVVNNVTFLDITDVAHPIVVASDFPPRTRPVALLEDEASVVLNSADYRQPSTLQKISISNVENATENISFQTHFISSLQDVDAIAVARGPQGLAILGRDGELYEVPTATFTGIVKTASAEVPALAFSDTSVALLTTDTFEQPTLLRPISFNTNAALIGRQSLVLGGGYPSRHEPPFDVLASRPSLHRLVVANGLGRIDMDDTLVLTPTPLVIVGTQYLDEPTVDGCLGFAFVEGRAVVVDACLSSATDGPALTTLHIAQDPIAANIYAPNNQLFTSVNEAEHMASGIVDGHAVLFDISDTDVPEIQAVFDDPDLSGLMIHANYTASNWVILVTPPLDPPLLIVLDVSIRGAPVVRLRQRLNSQPYVVSEPIDGAATVEHRLLSVEWPRAVFSTWRADDLVDVSFQRGHGIASLDLAAEPPVIEWELPLPSAAMDAMVVDDRLVVVRVDGVSVISPPCAP